MNELCFNKSPFWIQIHGLPLLNMSMKNAIAIGKGLSALIKVDEESGRKKIYRNYLRLLLEIDITQPLKVGFSLRREEDKSLWIYLKYERLDIYCVSCGRIGHKIQSCRAPSMEQLPKRYKISLKVNIFSNLPPKPANAWRSSVSETSITQPSQALIHGSELTQPRGAKLNSPNTNLIPLNSLKNLTIHTSIPKILPLAPVTPPSPNPISINETQIFSPIAVISDNPIKISPLNASLSSNQPTPHNMTNVTPTCSIMLQSNLV